VDDKARRLLLKAAAMFECIAQDIYICATVDGEWTPDSADDKREHKNLISTASRLRVLAKQPDLGRGGA
jgi:hypothetical protein